MQIKECTIDDVPLLAEMNYHLIEDENAETKLDLSQLEERMNDFINSVYRAFFFCENETIIGYALCDLSRTPIYLRQFFICRPERRKGYGKQAFYTLLDYLSAVKIDIDVYTWNKTGVAFWESLGFEKRCYNMRFNNTQ